MFSGLESAEVVTEKAEGESMLLISAVGETLTICKQTKSSLCEGTFFYLKDKSHFSVLLLLFSIYTNGFPPACDSVRTSNYMKETTSITGVIDD